MKRPALLGLFLIGLLALLFFSEKQTVFPFSNFSEFNVEQQASVSELKPSSTEEFCAHDHLFENWLSQNPANAEKHNLFEKDLLAYVLEKQNGGGNHAPVQYTLPVVVHIIHNNGPENITDAQVIQGIQDMNDAFENVGYYDQGTGLNMEIDFCLAKRDPDGNATTGITRDQSPLTSMDMNTQDIDLKNINRWDPLNYINIWLVGEIQGGVAGYAYFPTSHGQPEDGIVMESIYFGTSPDQSIVQTHEMGHYLGLYHTFQGGCTNNNCLTDGDRVCDTPPDQSTAWVPCASTPNTCSTDANSGFPSDQNDMIWNYMDYSDFTCYSAFTQGQKDRAVFTIENTRQSLLDSEACNDPCTSNITANFTASATTIGAGQTVNFANSSSGATAYDWRVDGTSFSSATNSSYTFNSVGTFEVVLWATNADPNCLDRDTVTITVNCPTVADFTGASLYPALGSTLNFTNTSTGATGYEWLINGVSQGTATDFSYTFDISGNYTLCLDAFGQFCDDSECVTMFVFEAPNECEGPFMKYFGEENVVENAITMVETPSGDLMIGGSKGDASLLMLVNAEGDPIWERTFDLTSGDDFIDAMMIDSDGMLVAAGRDEVNAPTLNFMFRYDFQSNNMLWTKIMPQPAYTRIEKIIELPWNDNYLMTGMVDNLATSLDGLLMEVEQTTGNQVWLKTFNADGNTDIFLDAETVGTDLYIGGVLRYGGLDKIRPSIAKFDQTGNQDWTRNYLMPTSGVARQYFQSIVIENNEITAFGHGDMDGSNANDYTFILVQTDLDGNLLWAKDYEIVGGGTVAASKVLRLPDGYFMHGTFEDGGTRKMVMIRTDDTGNVQWAKSVDETASFSSAMAVASNGLIYFTGATSTADPQGDILLGSITVDGQMGGLPCGSVSDVQIETFDYSNPHDGQNNLTEVSVNYPFGNALALPQAANLPDAFFPDCECEETTTDCQSTFIKTFGLPNVEDDGYVVTESDNGGFFMAGGTGNQSLLVKIEPTGTVAWARQFDLCPQNDVIRDIRLDSDGMLVGCGYSSGGTEPNFFFRYDHVADNFLWVKNLSGPTGGRQLTILEKSPGGNFTAFGQFDNCSEATAIEMDRNTGNIQWSKNYALGNCQTFSKTIIANGSIFTTGRYNFAGGGTNKMRGGITRLDLNGDQIWSRLYLVPVNPNNARLYPTGILEDNGNLISISQGDTDGTSATDVTFQLYSTDLDGNIQWAKDMNVTGGNTERMRDIVNLPDGYLILGTFDSNTFGQQIFLVKADKLGNIEWSKQYGDIDDEEPFSMLVNNGRIHFLGRKGTGANADFFLARLTLEGETLDPCDQIMDVVITSNDFVNPYDGSHPFTENNWNISLSNFASSTTEVTAEENPICESACEEICDNGIDDDGDDYIDCYDPDCPCYMEECAVTDIEQNFAMKLAWESTEDRVPNFSNAVIANLDPQIDDIPEIICLSDDGAPPSSTEFELLIFKGDGSNMDNPFILPIESGYDPFSPSTPVVGDIDNDGIPELIINCKDKKIRVYSFFESNGTPPMQEIAVSSDDSENVEQKPFLADFNADGISEIYLGNDIFQFDFSVSPVTLIKELSGTSHSGRFYNSGSYTYGNTSPVAADLLDSADCNGDPDCEGLELAAGAIIYSVDLKTNDGDGYEIKIQRDLNMMQSQDTYRDGYTVVADIDLDGILDVIVSAGKNSFDDGLYVWNRDGLVQWFHFWKNVGALPCVANVFDDTSNGAPIDLPEIIVTGNEELACLNLNAASLGLPYGAWWTVSTTDESGSSGATAFDFYGDGNEEIIYRDQEQLRILYGGNSPFPAGVDTERNWNTFTCGSGTSDDHPLIADVDNDKQAEIVVTGNTIPWDPSITDTRGRLRVFEADLLNGSPWMGARPIWNQFNYFVVNVNDDLSLPAQQQLHHLEFPDVGTGYRPFNKFLAQVPLLDNDYQPYLPVPDATVVVEGNDCSADSISVSLTICNVGSVPMPAETPITFYLGDPTAVAATVHHSVLLGVDVLPDSCFSLTANVPTANGTFFVVVNDDGSQPTPYNLGNDFPVTNIPECDYLNNLDQFDFNYTPPPPPDLGPDLSFCLNGIAELDAGPDWATYEWQDGFPEQVYTAWEEGTYWVTVTDSCGSAFSDTILIEMDTSIQFDLGPDTLICPGDSLVFDVPGFEVYEWVPSTDLSCADCNPVIATPLESATYTLVATDENGCVSVDSIFIEVGGEVEIFDTITICVGDSALIFGNYETMPGDYTSTLSNPTGCDTILNVTLENWPEVDIELISLNSCEGQDNGSISTTVSGIMPYTYEWSSGENTADLEDLPIGDYTLTVTDANGCTQTASITINEIPVGSVSAEAEDVSCFGYADGSVAVTEFPLGSEFSLDGVFFTTDTLFENVPAGNYTLSVETPDGCLIEQEITVGQPPEIVLNLPPDVTIELGDSIRITPQVSTLDSLTYVWSPTDWLSCPTCPEPWATPFESVEYTLQISNPDGCSDEDDIFITLLRPLNVYPPNAFSPNGDGINDNFTLYAGTGVAQIKRLLIFDRWGELVFEGTEFPPNQPEYGWDGTFRGEPMNPAVFAWFAEVEYVDGRVQLLEGDLTLVR